MSHFTVKAAEQVTLDGNVILIDTMLLWARLWSPLLDRNEFEAFAAQQELPQAVQRGYESVFNLFHAGFPAPAVSCLMHVSLNQDGGRVREDIVRVLSFMELQWSEHRLPPDHIAVLCDILAALLYEQQYPLANLVLERYILPWLDCAQLQLEGMEPNPAAIEFLGYFNEDIEACLGVING